MPRDLGELLLYRPGGLLAGRAPAWPLRQFAGQSTHLAPRDDFPEGA